MWEPCCCRWVPRSSWIADSKCYEWYTTHLSSPPLLGTRRRCIRPSLVGRSTNMKAIPWFAQHTSVVDGRWSVVTVLEEWATAPWTGCRASCARFEWVPLVDCICVGHAVPIGGPLTGRQRCFKIRLSWRFGKEGILRKVHSIFHEWAKWTDKDKLWNSSLKIPTKTYFICTYNRPYLIRFPGDAVLRPDVWLHVWLCSW